MQNGEKYNIEITDVSTSGEGIGRIDGAVTFVPGLVPGDVAIVEITGSKKNITYARVIDITDPSADRIEPECQLFGSCGGCTLQNMSYDSQLRLKERQLDDKLKRIFGGNIPEQDPAGGMEYPWKYRNKAEFAVGWGKRIDGSRGALVGFYDRGSKRVVESDVCLIQSDAADMAAAGLREYIDDTGISVYNEKTGKGLLRRMTVRTAFETGEVMIILTLNGKRELPEAQLLADIMSDVIGDGFELRSIALEYNSNRNIAAPGAGYEVIAGSEVISDRLADMNFEISPQSFYQVNPAQTEVLYETVLEFADPGQEDIVFDLYCGVGTIGLYCARRAKYVWGIESVKKAVVDANRNAVINGLVNIRFIAGKAEEKIDELIETAGKPDIVILDPPRAGCRQELLEAVLNAGPSRIIYVSCEPATMARDLKLLTGEGMYEFRRIKLVDQFCHTIRAEVVCLLEKM